MDVQNNFQPIAMFIVKYLERLRSFRTLWIEFDFIAIKLLVLRLGDSYSARVTKIGND